MNTKIYLKSALLAIASLVTFSSCVQDDDYSVPAITCTDKFAPANHTLQELAALGTAAPTAANAIKEDFIVEAFVSSSDESGNIYKTLYVQDKPENPTIAMEIDIDGGNLYTQFPLGAKVKINAKGLIVQAENGNVKLGIYDPAYAIGRINPNLLKNYLARVCGTDNMPVKATMVPVVFNSIAEAMQPANVNKLVTIKNVQFKDIELPKAFVDVNVSASNRMLEDKNGASIIIRNSSYASFARLPISPDYAGSGSVTMVLSRFGVTYQGYIRDLNDLNLKDKRFVISTPDPGTPTGPSASAVLPFKGADFENWSDFLSSLNSFGLKAYATQGIGLGQNGSNSLQIKGVPEGNDYVFTSLATTGVPASPKKITFYIKGTSVGKSLSVNVYKSDGSTYNVFNLGGFTTDTLLQAVDASTGNQYNGAINTGGQWKLVELKLTGLDVNTTVGKNIFAIKTGKSGNYDLQIDNIKIE